MSTRAKKLSISVTSCVTIGTATFQVEWLEDGIVATEQGVSPPARGRVAKGDNVTQLTRRFCKLLKVGEGDFGRVYEALQQAGMTSL